MFRFILYSLFFLLAYRFIRRYLSLGDRTAREASPRDHRNVQAVRCVVCETFLPLADAMQKQVGGKFETFCSTQCYERWLSSGASS